MDRKELSVAVGLLVSGSIGLAWGLRGHPQSLSMAPAMDGCLVVGVVGFLLAVAQGLRWIRALVLLTPVFAVQVLATRAHGAPTAAVMGLEAAVLGTIGLALASRPPRLGASEREAVQPRPRRTAAASDSRAASSSPPLATTSG